MKIIDKIKTLDAEGKLNFEELSKFLLISLKEKDISLSKFTETLKNLTANTDVIYKSFKKYLESSDKLSQQTLEIYSKSIEMLGENLKKADTEEERKKIRKQILKLCIEAKKLEDNTNQRKSDIFKGVLKVLGFVLTAIVFVATKGKIKK